MSEGVAFAAGQTFGAANALGGLFLLVMGAASLRVSYEGLREGRRHVAMFVATAVPGAAMVLGALLWAGDTATIEVDEGAAEVRCTRRRYGVVVARLRLGLAEVEQALLSPRPGRASASLLVTGGAFACAVRLEGEQIERARGALSAALGEARVRTLE